MSEATTQGRAAPPRAEGCVLWLYGPAWEDLSELDPARPPIPVDEWITLVRDHNWPLSWTPAAAIVEGPYRGGVVVQAGVDGDRAYVAVPPELLDHLRELLPEQQYRMVREDVTNMDNRQGHGYSVTRLDPAAWEERHELLALSAPITTEAWARKIRQHHMRVVEPGGTMLGLDTPYPGGQVVAVDDATGRSYFAVPRAAVWLAFDLADETATAGLSGSATAAASGG